MEISGKFWKFTFSHNFTYKSGGKCGFPVIFQKFPLSLIFYLNDGPTPGYEELLGGAGAGGGILFAGGGGGYYVYDGVGTGGGGYTYELLL